MQDYIDALKEAIWNLHGCRSDHIRTVLVHAESKGKTIWDGEVEVFSLANHPRAIRAYAWAHLEGEKDEQTRFVTLLEIPPVKDALTAVQASIMADSKTPQPGL